MLIPATKLCDAIGLPRTTLVGWIEQGIIEPHLLPDASTGCKGTARFTIMQAVGLGVGAALRRSLRGASAEYVALMMRAYEMAGIGLLEACFKCGLVYHSVLTDDEECSPRLTAYNTQETEVNVHTLYNKCLSVVE